MTRYSFLVAFAAAAILVACGKSTDLPQKPQIERDRNEMTFGGPVLATYVGTQTAETLLLKNGGKDDLHISDIKVTGANASLFQISHFGVRDSATAIDTLPVKVPSNDSGWVELVYKPSAAGTHTATLTITSDAENQPTLTLSMKATAVNPK